MQQFQIRIKYSGYDSPTDCSLHSGFGFYPRTEWEIFEPLRASGLGGGNYSEEQICSMIGNYWDMQHSEDGGEYCRPQWVRAEREARDLNDFTYLYHTL